MFKLQNGRLLDGFMPGVRNNETPFLLRFWISLDVDILGMEHFGKL
jgi:hypothetical protein